MTGRAVRVAWYRFRAGHARRWTGYVSVVLLIGSIGGVAMASVAGARRTESSFRTYQASTNPSTIGLFSRYDDPALGMSTGYDPKAASAVAHVPLVVRSTTTIIFDGNIDLTSIKGLHTHVTAGESPSAFTGSLNGEYSAMDRVTLIAGRRANPSRRDEAVMNAQAARQMGLHVGSVIQIPFYTDAETQSPNPSKPFLVARVRLVGEVVASRDVIEGDIGRLNSAAVIFTPALTRMLAPKCATGTETFMQLRGGAKNAKRVMAEVYRVDPAAAHFPAQITAQFIPIVQATITPDAIALAVFGGIAGLSLLLIAGLMIARIVRVASDDTGTLRALGADRSTMLVDQLLGVVAALIVGALIAVVAAVVLSPLTPLGPVRPVYPSAGVAFDWTVLGSGAVVLLVVLTALSVFLSRREVRGVGTSRANASGKRGSSLVRSVANSGLPVSVVTGVRFAIEPGRGRNAAPVRSALSGAVLAVTVLISTVTFGASLNSLVSHANLYGWNWDYALLSSFAGAEDLPGPQITGFLNHDRVISAWSGVNFANAKLDGQRVQMLAEKPGAAVAPPILSGRDIVSANEIVLGGATLTQLHEHVGGSVTFSNGISQPKTLRIVGTATMPALGNNMGMGVGALTSLKNFPGSLLNLQGAAIPGPSVVLVRIRPGVSASVARRSLEMINAKVNAIPAASGLGGGVISDLRPIQIVNFRSMGTTPTIFASVLAIGAVIALGLTVSASVRRRRRELALLKALGLTRRQLVAAISWQATVAAVVGAVVGIPLGVAIGRQLWVVFARSIDAVPVPAVPALTVVLVGAGALLFANLVAALPGRSASRTPVALVLRSE